MKLSRLMDVPAIAQLIGFSVRHTRRLLDDAAVPRVEIPVGNVTRRCYGGTRKFVLKYNREDVERWNASHNSKSV